MRITRKQLRRIIQEAIKDSISDLITERQFSAMPNRRRTPYHQVSPGTKSMANAAKRKFLKLYPKAKVKIDGRNGWIIVNSRKSVNISSRDGKPGSIEDWVASMEETHNWRGGRDQGPGRPLQGDEKPLAPEDIRNRKPIKGPAGQMIQAKGLRR
jgi:hypothetical protein